MFGKIVSPFKTLFGKLQTRLGKLGAALIFSGAIIVIVGAPTAIFALASSPNLPHNVHIITPEIIATEEIAEEEAEPETNTEEDEPSSSPAAASNTHPSPAQSAPPSQEETPEVVDSNDPSGEPTSTPASTTDNNETLAPTPLGEDPFRVLPDVPIDGATLTIPALSLTTGLTTARIVDNTWDVESLGNQVGYLQGSAPPGQGNTVLAGHVDDVSGSPGPFAAIGSLSPGSAITLQTSDGITYTYQVTAIEHVHSQAMGSTYPTDDVQLTLITCTGWNATSGAYTERIVVTAALTSS